MGEMIKLTAADGHEFDAYKATPSGTSKGGICVIRKFLAQTRQRPFTRGIFAGRHASYFRAKVGDDGPVADIAAVVKELQSAGKVGTVGYCWGTVVMAATRIEGVSGSVVYYGGQTAYAADGYDMDAGIPIAPALYDRADEAEAEIETISVGDAISACIRRKICRLAAISAPRSVSEECELRSRAAFLAETMISPRWRISPRL